MMHSVENSAAGIALGMIIGIIKSVLGYLTAGIAMLSWSLVFETAILAFIGGVVGWIGTQLMITIKKCYKKFIKKYD